MALAQQQLTPRARAARASAPAARSSARAVRRVVTCRAATTETRFVPRWPQVYDTLRAQNMETISPANADSLVKSGQWVLVDVRRADQFAAAAPLGAVNIPLYRKIEFSRGFDPTRVMRSIMYAFNGVEPIEPNSEFIEQLAAAAAGGKGLIFACEAGGTLKPTVNFPAGKASRSLQACYKAAVEGRHAKVKHLDRGIFGWYQANLDFTGEYKPEIGRFPTAAGEPSLKNAGQGKDYEVRRGDKAK
ncbi:MAG: rhodanese-like protein [Monoraphidium minutum]|nr:MAG: rhodanese-like protein [Monoraphidium minutum]